MKVVFDESDHFHPDFDESVPNQGVGPEWWGGGPNFAFLPSPAPIFAFVSCWSFRGILVVSEALGRSNVIVWSSRSCEDTTKIQRRPPTERRKKEISERNFGRSWGGVDRWRGGPTEGGPREKLKNLEHTHHTHTNNNHQQAPPTGTKQAPTSTSRHQQVPAGTSRHQQTTTNNNQEQQQQHKIWPKHHQNWPNAVWPNAVMTKVVMQLLLFWMKWFWTKVFLDENVFG